MILRRNTMYKKRNLERQIIKRGFLFSISFLAIGALVAQEQTPEFKYSVDLNRFRYSDSLTYLEFSVDLNRNMLKYIGFAALNMDRDLTSRNAHAEGAIAGETPDPVIDHIGAGHGLKKALFASLNPGTAWQRRYNIRFMDQDLYHPVFLRKHIANMRKGIVDQKDDRKNRLAVVFHPDRITSCMAA